MKITIANYPDTAGSLDISQLSKEDQGLHEQLLMFGQEIADILPADALAEMEDLVATVNRIMNGSGSGAPAPKAPAPKAPRAPRAKAEAKPKAEPKPKAEAKPKATKASTSAATKGNVRGISKAIALIKGFVTTISKPRTKDYIDMKLRGIQRAMLDGSVTKATAHAKEVDECQDYFIKALRNWPKPAPAEGMNLNITDDAKRAKLVGLAGGEVVFESVAVLKAYLSLVAQQKPVTQTQLDNLQKRTIGPKITENDPFKLEIKAIQVALKAAKPGKLVNAASVGLAGIHKSALAGLKRTVTTIDAYKAKGKSRTGTATKKKAPRKAVAKRRVARKAPAGARRPFLSQRPSILAEW